VSPQPPRKDLAGSPLDPLAEAALDDVVESLELLTFMKNPDKMRTDPVARHPTTGLIVFPDKRRQGGTIKAGETYFCEVREHESGFGSTIYYADPVIRVDAGFLFDLRPDQVGKLVDALLEAAKEPLLEQARAQIGSQVERAVRTEMEALRRERDEAAAALDGARSQLGQSQEEAARLRLESIGLAERVGELEDAAGSAAGAPARDLTAGGAPSTPAAVPGQDGAAWTALSGPGPMALAIRRPSPEHLESTQLTYPRYFVHVSPDRRVLLVRPHPEGNLPAVGGRLTVPTLGMLRPFSGPEELAARTDPRSGGLLVDIS
jgi:hypothetical protein